MSSFDDAKFHAAIVSSMEGAHVFKQILKKFENNPGLRITVLNYTVDQS